jgi:hypothetical protein
VRVRYQDAAGATKELELSGWPARIFQHEFDHLQVRRPGRLAARCWGGRGRGRAAGRARLPPGAAAAPARAACQARLRPRRLAPPQQLARQQQLPTRRPRARPAQGALFHDRMKPPVLETVRPQLLAMEEAFAAAHPGLKIQRMPAAKVSKGFGSK